MEQNHLRSLSNRMKNHRIAAGGIIIKNKKNLLVRYKSNENGSFLAAPGGAVEDNENIIKAIKREVLEETGINVEPVSVLMIEDLDCNNFKMCKIWMSCKYISGDIQKTQEAKSEGIIEIGWFSENDIKNQLVFPSIIKDLKWEKLIKLRNIIEIPISRKATF